MLSLTAVQHLPALLLPFAFAALHFAHRSFDAFEIFALAAADITRFFPPVVLALLLPVALPLLSIPVVRHNSGRL
jgi:hypothetical protein